MTVYSLSGVSVLVVDDNQFMRKLLIEALQAMGVGDVAVATNGVTALEKLRAQQVDLVVTDLEMENGGGLELIRAVRKGRSVPDPLVPILVLSANTLAKTIHAARDAGMTEFLAKPITAKALYRRISAIVETPRNFVRTNTYFGPDRRRRNDPNYRGERRRATDRAERG
jgi:two-component system, chemotaxis family, chemotaxis protein CheY